MTASLLSAEVESALKLNGIPTTTHIHILNCEPVIPTAKAIAGEEHFSVHSKVESVIREARKPTLSVIVTGSETLVSLIEALNRESIAIGVIAFQPDESQASALRASGAMDVVQEANEERIKPLMRRGVDLRALLALELAHRCESKRLINRELELLGQPPEGMSDDLNGHQPPPLPVGPMSVYNLEDASEAFERAYIDRVQQLCASAREAAQYLGVSSATLSRRLRREAVIDGS